jgi:hypothetical protein
MVEQWAWRGAVHKGLQPQHRKDPAASGDIYKRTVDAVECQHRTDGGEGRPEDLHGREDITPRW